MDTELSTTGTPTNLATIAKLDRDWSVVFGCFLIYINTWGFSTSFGAYQSYYQIDLLASYSPATISWIGTVQVFLFFFVSIIAGPMYDRGYSKILLVVGCILLVFGVFMLSLSSTLWQILLSQSVCTGIGSGLIFVPAVATVSHAFDAKRPLALGLAACGSAVGGTVFPIMFRRLQPTVGFAWTNRIFGFIELATSALAIFIFFSTSQTSNPSRRPTKLTFDLRALREPAFAFLCTGLFFIELGFWIPPFTLPPYAQITLGTGADYAFYLLAIMNAGSLAGRVLPAYASQIQRIGPGWTLVAGSAILGALILIWLAVHNVVGITIWAVFVGFMSGITVSVPNAVLPKLSPPGTEGARSGLMWGLVAFGALLGTPLASLLVNVKTQDYRKGQIFSGLSICLGAGMLCVPAVYVSRKRSD